LRSRCVQGSDNASSNGGADDRCADSGSDYTSSNGGADDKCADSGADSVSDVIPIGVTNFISN